MKGKFILFLIILSVMAGIVGYWYWQKNIYSKGLLRLEILGPSEVQLLEEVEWTVKYKNNGHITLEDAKLIFEYPEYSLVGEGGALREQIPLEDIYPGEEKSYQFRARLLGEENEVKKAKVLLSYRPKNLRAFYESETTLTTVIKHVLLSFELDLPSKLESGREINFSLNYFSSLDYPLSDLRVKLNYPSGFEFQESRPSGLDETEWELGGLNKAEGGRIEVKGRLSGELNEQKIFQASLGVWQKNDFVLLKETSRGVKIIKPLLSVFQRINGQEDYTANPGDWLHYEIFFRNMGEEPFRHLFLISKLSDDVFDLPTLRVESGQVNREEKSIIWDWRNVAQLQFLDRGEEGKVEFWLKLKEIEPGGFTKKNALLSNKVIISEIKEEFETKINSKLEFYQAGYFEDEVFGNQGPIPPKVGKATTYTIIWQMENCCNDVKNVKVKAVLPINVTLTGQIFPEDTRLTFDSDSREIIWEIGDLGDGQTPIMEPQSCAFQISLRPTPIQRGKTAQIIGEAQITGEDQWTEETVTSDMPAIDTSLPDDKTVKEQQGVVQ